MSGYRFDLTCPGCGGELVHVASGSKRPWQQAAMARCVDCRREVLITVEVSFSREESPAVNDYRIERSRKEIADEEHEAALARSEAALAGVA